MPEVVKERHMIPMRDGVRLATKVDRPEVGEPVAALVGRTPYGFPILATRRFVEAGFAVVAQDCRGRFRSEGDWEPMRADGEDGFDTIAWVLQQPWSNGKIGTILGSYGGFSQWATAVLHPEGLVAMAAHYCETDHHRRHYAPGGLLRLGTVAGWAISVSSHTAQRAGVEDPLMARLPTMEESIASFLGDAEAKATSQRKSLGVLTEVCQHRPFREQPNLAALAPWMQQALDHPDGDDPFWAPVQPGRRLDEVADIPNLAVTGWYDYLCAPTLATHAGLSRGDGRHRLVVGPWVHGGTASTVAGEVDFGPAASFDIEGLELAWFDHWLRGADNGVADEPTVHLFVLGAGEWRDEHEWPLARTAWTPWHLHEGGGLGPSEPGAAGAPATFTYDPADPTPSLGGDQSNAPGAFDQRPVEARHDVVVSTSEVLAEPLTLIGPVSATVWFRSSAPCTDVVATLVDVHPDGRALNLCQGASRVAEATTLQPVAVDLGATAVVLAPGHRLRLDLSSASYPNYAPSPNTTTPFAHATAEEAVPADQEVHRSAGRASRVVLPVIPDRA